jgi:nucleoside-diphosphate-sugar epimerase
MSRLLVTGATGFIGRHVLPLLAKRDYEIFAVSSSTQGDDQSTATWIQADLLNPVDVCELIRRVKPTHLLHLAWYGVPGKYWTAVENLHWLQASVELLRSFAEHGGQRAVFAGSCAEYDWRYGYCSECVTPLQPSTLYGVCKHALQQVVAAFCSQINLSCAWGRIFFIYGPHEHPNRLVAAAVTTLLRGERFACSHATQVRDYLHVEDVAEAFSALVASDVQGCINVASGLPVTIKEILSRIGRKLDRSHLIEWGALPARHDEPGLLMADVTRLKSEVGWAQQYDLESGLDDTLDWWKTRV